MMDDHRTQDDRPASTTSTTSTRTTTTADSDGDAELRAELRVRDSVQPGARGSIAEIRSRIEDLVQERDLDAVETTIWGRRIPLDADDALTDEMRATFQRFHAWALRTDADLEPAFRVHETTTIGDEGSETVVTVPLVCLALYRDGDVVAVYPHSREGDAVTIQQGLERLESQSLESTPVELPGR